MPEISNFQKSIVELIDNIGNSADIIEAQFENLSKTDFLFVDDNGYTEMTNIYSFIISFRNSMILYNEIRENLFDKLNSGFQILKVSEIEI